MPEADFNHRLKVAAFFGSVASAIIIINFLPAGGPFLLYAFTLAGGWFANFVISAIFIFGFFPPR